MVRWLEAGGVLHVNGLFGGIKAVVMATFDLHLGRLFAQTRSLGALHEATARAHLQLLHALMSDGWMVVEWMDG